MKKKDQKLLIVIALVVFAIYGANQLGFISLDGISISHSEYVPRGGSGSTHEILEATFNKSASFDLSTSSKTYGDWRITVIDNQGREKNLWSGEQYQWTCTDGGEGSQLEVFRYSGKVQIFIEDSFVSIKEPFNNNQTLNFITYDQNFGGEPYRLKLVVTEARTSHYGICNNRGISYLDGSISISNVLFENSDPVVIVDDPVDDEPENTGEGSTYLLIFGAVALLGVILWRKKK